MTSNADNASVVNNTGESRFEITVDGHLAVAEYRRHGKRITFIHTKVPDELSGQGIGGKLARTALDYARHEGLEVVPLCPFINAYIKSHQEYLDLVARPYREGASRGS